MKRIVFIQQIGDLDRDILRKLKKSLKWTLKPYNLSIDILEKRVILNKVQKKYHADEVMKLVHAVNLKREYFRILGVIDSEIFVNLKDGIFGSARNPVVTRCRFSPVALISVVRFREKEFYRRKENKTLFELRTLKEAIHELGHSFGLLHCSNNCVMAQSITIEDTDKKSQYFCESCKNQLNFLLK